ncbi:PIN-like domain-containing protein [Actinoalloteichus hymeniacidonis]|uniref:VapC45 PIN like domain-containing protein n=1 Tax=Actinoalloteichus hymeniacidonis TaxID=340345 RepID=A0AAC9MWT9_9PSEU|nr:hypothetical protein [Actinoalloteichus hymeniacidonis]AOS61157.1 hypothetical protein TL08_01590 [Actinoalloteichus hymeniacidonis]MBB5910842.1 hypothetical protein [Actinoalloteichus hymeniacidonis]
MAYSTRMAAAHHKVSHVGELKWSGKKDLALLPDATKRGYAVFLTKDARQLEDPLETDAIKKSGMHHVFNPGSKQRFERVDPAKAPPRYWPR